jgi:MFS family permease
MTAGRALRFVVLVGVVSLFADMTYEGARSITGPYLAVLGATGTVVGLVAGLGELVGYAFRLVSGRLADRTGRYWAITFFGYALNVLAVPLLALTGRWEVAAALMIAERLGKAIRTPARDAMLSHVSGGIGHGAAFGLHEALDQAGAVAGPLLVAAIMYARGGYSAAFGVLVVPALLCLAIVLAAWRLYPRPRDLEASLPELQSRGYPTAFWIYLVASSLIAAAYLDFPLIAYHLGKHQVLPSEQVPVLYAFSMGTAAVSALSFGYLFDRLGLAVLIAGTVLSSLSALLVIAIPTTAAAYAGMALWGIGQGAHESVLRAAIAGMVPAARRGTAYGLFNMVFGFAWFAGSALMGLLYDVSPSALVSCSVGLQLVAIVPLAVLARAAWSRPRGTQDASGVDEP